MESNPFDKINDR